MHHYATSIDRQLWEPPFGEYLVLLIYVVSGRNDLLANLPQWLAGVGSAVVAMETTRVLGGDRRTRLSRHSSSPPSVVLESSSTQTDLLAAFWLAIAAYLAISELVFPTSRLQTAVWSAARP